MINQEQFNLSAIKEFYQENITSDVLKNTGLTVVIFAVVIVAQVILHAVVQVVDSVPVFNSLMQVVGVYATIRFAMSNLSTQQQRDDLMQKVRNTYQEVIG